MATKKKINKQPLTLQQQADEILRIAEEYGVEQNFFFLTTFKRYQVQINILTSLEKKIKEVPAIKGLLVPISRYAEVAKEITLPEGRYRTLYDIVSKAN